MILLNFAHPITPDQLKAITELVGESPTIISIPCQIDMTAPIAPQVAALADAADLDPAVWQGTPILINPPSLSIAAAALLAELHGRMGYFPPVVRLRSAGGTPPRFDVAEIVNLQDVRNEARRRR